MKHDALMFAGVFGLALSACAAPAATPEERQETVGKVTSAETFNCTCSGMPGEWSGSYSSAEDAANDIGVYCRYGGSCNNANMSSSTDGYGGSDGTGTSGGFSGTGTGTGSSSGGDPGGGAGTGGSGGGSSSGGAPANGSNIPRDATFRSTDDSWSFFHTYHHERSEAGFADGDSVRFFDDIKSVKNYQSFSAFSSLIDMPYAAGVVIWALGKLSDAQVDAMAAAYAATGQQQGIRVVLDVTTDAFSGRTENYLIYDIVNGALLGQTSIVFPSMVSNDNGRCQYGTYGDVGIAVQSCSNGITGCNSGYNCL